MNHLFEMMPPLRTYVHPRLQVHVDDLRRPSDRESRLALHHRLDFTRMPCVERGAVDRAKLIGKQDFEIQQLEERYRRPAAT